MVVDGSGLGALPLPHRGFPRGQVRPEALGLSSQSCVEEKGFRTVFYNLKTENGVQEFAFPSSSRGEQRMLPVPMLHLIVKLQVHMVTKQILLKKKLHTKTCH